MVTAGPGAYIAHVNDRRRPNMKKHGGGEKVPGGFYWKQNNWEIEVVKGDEGKLPGDAGTTYVRIPTLAMLVGAPVMGGLFVVFLPFLGFVMLANHFGKKAVSGLKQAADEVGAAVGPRWQPGEAYLAGKKKTKKGKKAAGAKEEKTEEPEAKKN
jgi:hypothetical protein